MSHRSLNYYWPSYMKVAKLFRNWPLVCWQHYWRRDIDEAVFWNGRSVRMPAGRQGLAATVVEIWGTEVYTSGGFYEPEGGHLVLDIGANVGLFSLWVAQRSPQTRVIAVEPSVDNVALMAQNLSEWSHQVSTLQAAVGGRAGRGTVIDGGGRSVDDRFEFDTSGLGESGSVEVMTLEGLLDSRGADTVDLLKMDIEGCEFEVFSDVTDATLRRIRRISLEYHDNLRPGTLALVQRRLATTHTISSVEGSANGYGIIRAVSK